MRWREGSDGSIVVGWMRSISLFAGDQAKKKKKRKDGAHRSLPSYLLVCFVVVTREDDDVWPLAKKETTRRGGCGVSE